MVGYGLKMLISVSTYWYWIIIHDWTYKFDEFGDVLPELGTARVIWVFGCLDRQENALICWFWATNVFDTRWFWVNFSAGLAVQEVLFLGGCRTISLCGMTIPYCILIPFWISFVYRFDPIMVSTGSNVWLRHSWRRMTSSLAATCFKSFLSSWCC